MKKLYMLVAVMFLSACGGHSASDWLGEWGEDGDASKDAAFKIVIGEPDTPWEGKHILVAGGGKKTDSNYICKLYIPEESASRVTCGMDNSEIFMIINGDKLSMWDVDGPTYEPQKFSRF